MGTTRLAGLDLPATVLTLVVVFFTVAGLEAPVGLGSGVFGLAVFLVVVTFGYLGESVTGSGFGLGVGLVTLTTHPLGKRGSTPRPGPTAQ